MTRSPSLSRQINRRLTVLLAVGWVMTTILVVLGMVVYYRTDQEYSRVLHQIETLQDSAYNLNSMITEEVLNTRAFLISGEESAATKRRLAHNEVVAELDSITRLTSGEKSLTTPALETIHRLHNEYDAVADQLFELYKAGRTTEALELFEANSDPLVISIQNAGRSLQNEIRQGITRLNTDFSRGTVQAILILGFVFLAALAMGSVLLVRWVSPLVRSLDYFETTLINAANTQVFHPIETWPEHRYKPTSLVEAYNRMALRLSEGSTSIIKYIRTMHHEVNTLMAAIIGYGYMLSDSALRPDDADVEEYGKIIVQQGYRVTHLVEDFTLAMRIEGSDYAPTLLPVRLAPLLSSVVEDLANDLRLVGADCNILLHNCPDSLLVVGDSLGLENAFRKVFEYALDVSPKGAAVVVDAEIFPSPRCLKVRVCDRGPAIPVEDLPLLFRPFSHIPSSTDQNASGSGLGLFIADSILRAHRGAISVETQPGKGTVFTITLPLEVE